MIFKFKDYATIKDINEKDVNISELRREFRICVIDDEEFAPMKKLTNSRFDIMECPDPTDILQLNDYSIVLCDIKGVGMHFGSEFQGAFLIKEIRQRFPYKTIISYTGETWDQTYNEYLSQADDWIQKDAKIEEWILKLDNAIRKASKPTEIWKKVRRHLVSQDIDTYEILKLEDAFTRAITQKKASIFEKSVNASSLPTDLKSIAIGLVSNGAFYLILKHLGVN
jgi:DNA-binding NtrC family response regulator